MKMNKENRLKRIVVLGAGTMGQYLAGMLQNEQLNVVLVDNNPRVLAEAAETYDVQTLLGNGANPEILERAGVREAQLVLALTDSCEVNLLAAFNAKQMGAEKTVVRTRSAWTLDTSRVNLRTALNIDLLLNPEILTAAAVVKFLDNPDALVMNYYAHGKVQLRQFVMDAKSEFCHRALKDCQIPAGVLVVMRSRAGEVVIPKGNHILTPGDKVTIVGLPARMGEAQKLFHAPTERLRHVTIAGGGNSGRFLAETLENRNFEVKLIEPDPERCEYLSERLRRTTIIQGDATRIGFMKEERIDASDVFIAVTGDDEGNLMSCLLAKELGVKQTVARIHRPDYASLVQKMGVDLALSPRHIMADRIMGMVLGGRIKSVSLMEEGKVEVIEFLAERDAAVVGRSLNQIEAPDGTLFAAIVHHGRVIVPRGENEIHPGDTVIVVGLSEKMDDVEKMFQAR